ncbi:hypothetical protein V6N13_128373 [Hibiscus sabdariffa]|uniref:Uncharacterized protein n=1 Tax=Hibiscus sabdariffa TaxID=183260 RepID=A0ABR2P150_9ROSI
MLVLLISKAVGVVFNEGLYEEHARLRGIPLLESKPKNSSLDYMNDLLRLFQPFGVITKLVMLRAKNQALLQMQDVPSTINAMQFNTNVPGEECLCSMFFGF